MNLKWWFLPLLLTCLTLHAQVKLKVGSLTLGTSDLTQASCIQIPIFMEEFTPGGHILLAVNITIALSGDVNKIDGGEAAEIIVSRAFTPGPLSGITSPGTDLINATNDPPTPVCTNIFNQATQGFSDVDFEGGTGAGFWLLGNDGEGLNYKTGFVFAIGTNLGTIAQGEEFLIAVLEIPLIANPGEGTITMTPVAGEALNFIQWDDGMGGLPLEDFDLSKGPGTITICPQGIVSQPQSQTVCPGDDVSFSVSLSGPGPITYQWRKDGDPIDGATSASLNLTGVTLDDAGSYDCQINSDCANVTTAPATLSFNESTVTIDPAAAVQGLDLVTFTANPFCEIPPAGYEWRDEDDNLLGTDASLTLDPAPQESAFYTLTMTDGGSNVVTAQAGVLVNPLGLDLNGDGFNTLADLWFVTEDWNEASIFDVDGDGMLTVADMAYIDTGQ